jgi:hypothetical protein
MSKHFLFIVASILAIHVTALRADRFAGAQLQAKPASTETVSIEVLKGAAIATLIIAGSIAIYKATGHPCAFPATPCGTGELAVVEVLGAKRAEQCFSI